MRPPLRRSVLPSLAAVLLLGPALVGCGRHPGASEPEASPQLRSMIFVAVGINDEQIIDTQLVEEVQQILQRAQQTFNAIQPGVRLEVLLFDEEQMVEQLRRRHRSGLGPDLIWVNGDTAQELARQGLTRPVRLPPSLAGQYPSSLLGRLSLGAGRLAAIPTVLQPQLACFDRRRIPRSPATLQELLQASSAGLQVGLPLDPVHLAWTLGSLGALNSMEAASRGDPLTPTLRQPVADWLAWLKSADLERNVSFSPAQGQLLEELISGQLGWITCRSIHLPRLRQRMGPHLGVATLPSGPGGEPSPVSRQRVVAFGVDSNREQAEAAEALGRFMLNPMVQRTASLRTNQTLPATQAVRVPVRDSSILAAMVESQRQSIPADSLPLLSRTNDPDARQLKRALTRYLYGDIDLATATDQVLALVRGKPGR